MTIEFIALSLLFTMFIFVGSILHDYTIVYYRRFEELNDIYIRCFNKNMPFELSSTKFVYNLLLNYPFGCILACIFKIIILFKDIT